MQEKQQKQLFVELTPEQAATVEGGVNYVGYTGEGTLNFHYKAGDGEWTQASATQATPWEYTGTEKITISWDYVPGATTDAYATRNLMPDSYYVYGANADNSGWYDMYESDNTYAKGSLYGGKVGSYPTNYPN